MVNDMEQYSFSKVVLIVKKHSFLASLVTYLNEFTESGAIVIPQRFCISEWFQNCIWYQNLLSNVNGEYRCFA